jgi:iron(III) transport system substrate-binding protein
MEGQMKNRRYFFSAFLAALVAGIFFAHAARAQTLQSLHAAGKTEGEVTIWSPNSEIMEFQVPAFKKQFPGIQVNFFEIRPSDSVARIIAEAKQGIVSLDIGTGRYAAVAPLIERDLIQGYDDWTKIFKELNPAAVSSDGKFLANGDNVFILGYNTNLVKPEEAPATWEDLLAPKWKGKVLIEPRGVAFAYLGLVWGEEKMVAYVRRLKEQVGSFVKGGTTVAQQLAAGAGHLAIGAYSYKILQLKKDGAPVDYSKKVSPIAATGQDIFVMKGAKHPSAARLLVGWLASKDGQRIMESQAFKGSMIPGSSYITMVEAERNNVRVVREDLQNYKKADSLGRVAAKAMGVFK